MGIYGDVKKSSSNNLPRVEVKLDSKVTLKITSEFNALVRYLCKVINTVEWSGLLFFKAEGEFNTPEGLTITPVDIYPMNRGSAGYTEYEFDEDIMDYYDAHPDRFGMKYGHIHSHNSMGVFFSGTDSQELADNCINHSYYVSVIVNNANDIIGKIAIPGKRKIKANSIYTFSGVLGTIINMPKDTDKEETVMYLIDMEVEKEDNKLFYDRVDEISKKSIYPGRDFWDKGRSQWDNNNNMSTFNNKSKVTRFNDKHNQASVILPNDIDYTDKYPITDMFVDMIGSGGGNPQEALLNLVSDEATKQDIIQYIESSFDLSSIIQEMYNYQRDFGIQSFGTDEIEFVAKGLRNVARANSSSNDYGWICETIIKVIDEELKISNYGERKDF